MIEFSQPLLNVKKGQQENFVKYWNQPKIVIWLIKLDQQPICNFSKIQENSKTQTKKSKWVTKSVVKYGAVKKIVQEIKTTKTKLQFLKHGK